MLYACANFADIHLAVQIKIYTQDSFGLNLTVYVLQWHWILDQGHFFIMQKC